MLCVPYHIFHKRGGGGNKKYMSTLATRKPSLKRRPAGLTENIKPGETVTNIAPFPMLLVTCVGTEEFWKPIITSIMTDSGETTTSNPRELVGASMTGWFHVPRETNYLGT